MSDPISVLPCLQGTRYSPIISTPDITDHVHNGLAYEVSGSGSIVVATDPTYVFTGTTGDIPVHFHAFNLDISSGPATIELIEAPTITVAGTPITSYNKNRNSAKTSTMVVTGGATITGGTVITTRKSLVSGQGSHVTSGNTAITGEWDLKTNTVYALRITAATDLDWAANMFWYEIDLPIV